MCRPRRYSIHNVKQPSFFPPGSFFVRFFFLFAFVAADPE